MRSLWHPGACISIRSDRGILAIRTVGPKRVRSRRRFEPIVAALECRTLLSTATIVTLQARSTVSTYGQPVQITATVTTNPPGGTTPTGGTVSFSVDRTQGQYVQGDIALGSQALQNGTAQFTTDALPAGSDSLTATYSGYGNFAASAMGASGMTTLPLTAAGLNFPQAVAADNAGDIFIANTDAANVGLGGGLIQEYNLASGQLTTLAGGGSSTAPTETGPGTAARAGISPGGRGL